MEKNTSVSSDGETGDIPLVDPVVDKMVGEKLRDYFDALLDDKVPDRIVELIVALGEREKQSAGGGSQ